MRLHGECLPVDQVSASQSQEMFRLLSSNFINASFLQFKSDLKRKDRVIILCDDQRRIQGFSTQVLIRHAFEGRMLRAVFSGDTIISPRAWGSMELPLVWGDWMMSLYHAEPSPIYWLLISKGMRTYRFLPTFFQEFFPRYDCPTLGEAEALMRSLGEKVFGPAYDAESGLVLPSESSYYLAPELAEIPQGRFQNPHVSYFAARNKSYVRGSELLCLARFEPRNLKPDYLRRLELRAGAVSSRIAAHG